MYELNNWDCNSLSVAKGIYINDLKKALSAKKDPVETFNIILSFFNFEAMEIRIYNLLLNTSLTIKEIEEQLDVSERSIRKYIKRLEEEGLITKRVEQGKRLKYVYQSIRIQEAWKKVEDNINKIVDDISDVMDSSSKLSSRGNVNR